MFFLKKDKIRLDIYCLIKQFSRKMLAMAALLISIFAVAMFSLKYFVTDIIS
jgi:hypothetical protein